VLGSYWDSEPSDRAFFFGLGRPICMAMFLKLEAASRRKHQDTIDAGHPRLHGLENQLKETPRSFGFPFKSLPLAVSGKSSQCPAILAFIVGNRKCSNGAWAAFIYFRHHYPGAHCRHDDPDHWTARL